MIWFTSDTHFGHENVLKFTDRPWETIWQMNDAIVDSINGKVAVDDELYILGDFSFKMTAQDAYALRKRIACRRIHLIPGNHDKDWTQPAVAGAFTVEPPICVLKIDGQKIVLSHYPMADWQGMGHGSWHLHGHIHSGEKMSVQNARPITDRNEKEKKFTDLANKHDLDKRYAKNCRNSFLIVYF